MNDKKILLVGILLFFIPFALADPISDDNFECNGFNCGTGWVSPWGYSGTCEITTLATPLDTYHMRGYSGCDAYRTFDSTGYNQVLVSFYATATSLETADTCNFYYNDGTTDHLLLTLVNGDDDGTHDYYEYDVTSYGLSSTAAIKMVGASNTGDYCYIDNIAITGTVDIQFNIFTDSVYTLSETTQIEMSSSLADTSHTIELYDEGDLLFCSDVITSPSSPFTSFYTTCTMPTSQQTNAYAKLYQTGFPGTSTTKYFNVMPIIQNASMLQISKAYFSPQVLQGGSTEIFLLIEKDDNVTVTSSDITLVFPDDSTRVLSVSPTENENEYRAFVTDTFQTGNVTFVVNIEGGNYYDSYTNQYLVAGYNVDFVDVVNSVAEVAVCKTTETVQDILEAEIAVFGTEYLPEQDAKVWLQLINENGTGYISDAICLLSIYTPQNTEFLEKTTMSYFENGIYYYDLIVPQTQGVYPAIAECYYGAQQVDVNTVGSDIIIGLQLAGTDYTNTFVEDGVYDSIKEAQSGGEKRIEFIYNFTSMCGTNTSEDLLTGLTFHWVGEWDSVVNDDVTVSIYNYTSGTWIDYGNQILSVSSSQSISNLILTNNVTRSGLVSSDGRAAIKFVDADIADTVTTTLNTDRVYLSCDQLTSPNWVEIRGASEMHISGTKNYVTEVIYGELKANGIYGGSFINHFVLGSQTNEFLEDQDTEFDLYYPFSCGHVLEVNNRLDNGTLIPYNFTGIGTGDSGCTVKISHDLEIGTNYDIEITSENFWKQQFGYWESTKSLELDIINVSCQEYVIANNQTPFTIPINSTSYGEDEFWVSCASYLDYEYHRQEIAAEFFPLLNIDANFTESEMEDLEDTWYHLELVTNSLDDYGTIIMGTLGLSADYSNIILTNTNNLTDDDWWAKGFAYISSTHINQNHILAVPNRTWNYNDTRTLTDYREQSISDHVWNNTNRSLTDNGNTQVAEAVWTWDGNIVTNILEQIAGALWEYMGATAEII